MIASLLNRLLLPHKFFILSIIALILTAIPTYLYKVEADKGLDAYLLEASGMAPANSALKVLQLTQQHRGLSALVLGGVESAKDQRLAKQQETDAAFAAMDGIVKNLHNQDIDASWNTARQGWEQLRSNVSNHSIDVKQSYAAHTALTANLLVVGDLIGDYYGLSLDPDVDTYQMIQAMYYHLPYLTEALGQLRAKGAGLLAKKEASQEDRLALSGIVANVSEKLNQVNVAYNKAVLANPDIGKSLGTSMQELNRQGNAAIKLAQEKIVNAETLDFPGPEYVKVTTEAIDVEYATNHLADKQLESMIADKITTLYHTRWLMELALLGLIALAGWIEYLIIRSVSGPLNHAVAIAERVAQGDLTTRFTQSGSNEMGQMLRALETMNDNLLRIVREVHQSIDNIGSASNDIASGNSDLSARTESQASSLEQTASSMEQLTSTVKQNADNAKQANLEVVKTSEIALHAGEVVAQVVQTMGEINESSRKIVDIISVIDGIAFQTNILALNAAVEAARAGEQGRGFAVVASEVRNLAQRSATAAKEIKLLIGDSVDKVEIGNKLVDQAGKSMTEIASSVKNVTSIMADIAMASMEQTNGIEQVNQAVMQMDEMTQQNSALVEQAAAAAESLNEQAQMLVEAMSVFKLDELQRTA